VSQLRLQPVVSQEVVTYTAFIDVANPELRLKPGMTATVTIEVARREDVLRVPASALRFRPTDDVLAALGGSSVPAAPAKARVRRLVNGALDPVDVEVGVSDGSHAELVGGSLVPGTELVTNVALAEKASVASAASRLQSPLVTSPSGMPPPPPPGAPPPG
jgi:HlyD family secretion protein